MRDIPKGQIVDFKEFTEKQVSNENFLRAVFGDERWDRAHVCAFREDPTELDTLGLRHYWAGGPAWSILGGFAAGENQYFTISLFETPPGDRQRRKKDRHEATYCIVLDDVGSGSTAKVPWDRVKLTPSWVLETSPGNFQVGYILMFPDSRSGKVSALLDAMVASGLCSGGKDPGMKGVTRYVRLPGGTNTKKVYGSHGFRHRLMVWAPQVVTTVEELAKAYGVLAEVQVAPDKLGTGNGVKPVPVGEDEVLDLLFRAGLVKQELSAGVWDIECPFIDEHTQRADSGAAYLSPGGFACHHGHCRGKTSAEFLEKIKGEYPAEFGAARRAALERAFGDIGGDRDPFAGLRDGVGDQAEKLAQVAAQGMFGGAFSLGDLKHLPAKLDANWLVKDLFPEQGMGVLYGAPKAGKSFVAMDLANRVGAGLDWNGHRVKRQGLVVYVVSEGGPRGAWNRAKAWGEYYGSWPDNVVFWPGSLKLGTGMEEDARALVAFCREQAARAGDGVSPVLVVLDTLNRNFLGDENSTQDMTGFVQAVDMVWRSLGCFVLLVHHSGKDTSRGLRGSSALLGAVDAEIEVSRDKDAGISVPGEVALTNLRHAEDGKRYGFRLERHRLGLNSDLEEEASLVAVKCKPPGKKVRLGKNEQIVRDEIMQSPGITLDGLKKDLPDIRSNNLRRVVDSLVDKGVIVASEGEGGEGYTLAGEHHD